MAKLTGEDQKKFLREKLEEQRHLLRKSIKEFATGDLTEALRIAIAMRILVHETGNSKPLLKQLTSNYLELNILDRASRKQKQPPSGTQGVVIMSVPISVKITNDGVFLNPDLDVEAYEPSILGKWWTRQSLLLPGLGGFSRREIVLGLADKEGGAHVDVNLPERYRQLLASKQLQIGWGKDDVSPLNLSRFMTAQAAVELLDCLNRTFPEKLGL
jgi:hypothetical protein